MLSYAGVAINGRNPWDIQVKDDRLYARVLKDKNLGLGEAYMEGWWDCEHLDEFIYRVLSARLDRKIKGSPSLFFPYLLAVFFNRQSKARSHIIADRHYNLGNDLFMSFLDSYNQYSCAYFDNTKDLSLAQFKKLDLICKKINLRSDDRVLDIGCGWGGFARYAAENYGCAVTAVNVSTEQIEYAKKFCKNLPVDVIGCDYRDIEGEFDKIVSIGMFEHVGKKNYRTFMRVANRCLKDGGIFLLHTIGSNRSWVNCDPWIAKYIFPNGMLPSIAQLAKSVEDLFVVEDLHNIGPHYDKTLIAWNENFQKAWPGLKEKYGERFRRMWEYYLLSCASAFRSRSTQLWQVVLTKHGTAQPSCR